MLAIGLKSLPHPKTEIERIFKPINIKTKDIIRLISDSSPNLDIFSQR
jgi:hypothetical protein